MKIDIKYLRWIFLGFYVAIVAGLLGIAYAGLLPPWLFPLEGLKSNSSLTTFVLLVTLGSQALFVFSAGTINLCRPTPRRRLLAPVIIASLMMTALVGATFVSLIELFKVDDEPTTAWIFWALIGIS